MSQTSLVTFPRHQSQRFVARLAILAILATLGSWGYSIADDLATTSKVIVVLGLGLGATAIWFISRVGANIPEDR